MSIRLMEGRDVDLIVSAFRELGWDKPPSQYESYLSEQKEGRRVVLVAFLESDFAGYLTIRWESQYPPFVEEGIPEISDLNVLPRFRRRGIATALIREAERRVGERSSVVGIGVGMTPDYGAAQRLYAVLQYLPDGRGLFHRDRYAQPGDAVKMDDLIQYLTKTVR